MVLKHLNPLLSPELMTVLMSMGHGDEIVFSDRNFPASSNAKRLINCQGTTIEPLLHAVLYHLPIDYLVEHPVHMMRIPSDSDYTGNILGDYQRMLDAYNGKPTSIGLLDRQDFYDRAARTYAIVVTGESARFANVIIRKGIVRIGEEL
ncbi:MAG: fucose isomerase [Spirochaetae bacterium HGW-Spirochaetae-2]|jgi:L-fucose mutarotase|nr:MAG: fucose isomerase [Spirochaetae bacterium HGW-Spirochaetae-2]